MIQLKELLHVNINLKLESGRPGEDKRSFYCQGQYSLLGQNSDQKHSNSASAEHASKAGCSIPHLWKGKSGSSR